METPVKTFDELITILYTGNEFKRMLRRYRLSYDYCQNVELKRDFEHDLIVILLEHRNHKRLIELYNTQKSMFYGYIIQIIRNNLLSKTSPYWKKYGLYNSKKTEVDFRIDVQQLRPGYND